MRGYSFVLPILYLRLNWFIFKWPLNVTTNELRASQLRRTLVILLVTIITVPYSKETPKYLIKHFMALNQHDNMGIQKWSQNKPMNLFSHLLQDSPIVSIKAPNCFSLDGHWHTSEHPPCPHFTPIPSLAQTLVPFGLLLSIKQLKHGSVCYVQLKSKVWRYWVFKLQCRRTNRSWVLLQVENEIASSRAL